MSLASCTRAALIMLAVACSPAVDTDGTIEMPARFIADRIFVDVPTTNGDTLHLYTDTGGGLFLIKSAAARVQWGDSSSLMLSAVAVDSFPDPRGAPNGHVQILEPPGNQALEFDGMLGQAWFADRVWTFDYVAQKLLLHPAVPALEPSARTVPLGFLSDSAGRRVLAFPRIPIVVDGDTLQMLFDTGATGFLTASAMAAVADDIPAVRATSFITTEVLTRWLERHADWRVLPNADETVPGMRMIEVPQVVVAGVPVGPVWFTERPDRNFHEYMSQWMDRRVDGALGGNALRFFRTTVDYPGAVAHFVPVPGVG